MKVILYTAPSTVSNEIETISALMDLGVDYMYLRKENKDEHYWMAFVEQIPFAHSKKIFSDHFRVLHEMELGGYHFSGKKLQEINPSDLNENLVMLRNSEIKSSATVRSFIQLKELDGKFDILLLAPLFESISKPGHALDWNFEELKEYLHNRKSKTEIFALGGIDLDKIDMVHLLGFDGIAVLGAIWNNSEDPVVKMKAILEKC